MRPLISPAIRIESNHAWRGDKDAAEYTDEPGFCMAAKPEEIAASNADRFWQNELLW